MKAYEAKQNYFHLDFSPDGIVKYHWRLNILGYLLLGPIRLSLFYN